MPAKWKPPVPKKIPRGNKSRILVFVAAAKACKECKSRDGESMTAAEWEELEFWTTHPSCTCKLVPEE